MSRQLVSSSSLVRSIAVPTQLANYIHTTHVTTDDTTPAGALLMAAKGMRVIPTRSQAAKEKLYGFIQVQLSGFILNYPQLRKVTFRFHDTVISSWLIWVLNPNSN